MTRSSLLLEPTDPDALPALLHPGGSPSEFENRFLIGGTPRRLAYLLAAELKRTLPDLAGDTSRRILRLALAIAHDAPRTWAVLPSFPASFGDGTDRCPASAGFLRRLERRVRGHLGEPATLARQGFNEIRRGVLWKMARDPGRSRSAFEEAARCLRMSFMEEKLSLAEEIEFGFCRIRALLEAGQAEEAVAFSHARLRDGGSIRYRLLDEALFGLRKGWGFEEDDECLQARLALRREWTDLVGWGEAGLTDGLGERLLKAEAPGLRPRRPKTDPEASINSTSGS